MTYEYRDIICITLKKSSQLKFDVHVPPKENFSLGDGLESVYPLLDMVFSYLDCEDLKSAALVKKSWAEVAQKILKKRNRISWITAFRTNRLSRRTFVQYSNNYSYDRVSVGIILLNSRLVSLSDSFCCHDFEDVCPPKKTKLSEVLHHEVVPSGATYCIIACSNLSPVFTKEIGSKSSLLFTGCFIPPIPNVQVSVFNCNPRRMRDDHISSNKKLRCLLFFSKTDLEDSIYTMLKHLLPEEGCQEVAFGGGIIHYSIIFPQNSSREIRRKRLSNLCITFTEDKNCESKFNSSSVVITGNSFSSDEFEAELLKFKGRIIIRSNSFAVKICCSAKSKKSQETRLFHKVFPNTPMLGLEADGEIGWNCSKNPCDNEGDEQERTKKIKTGYPTVQHSWSTVIVFLTWGQIINN